MPPNTRRPSRATKTKTVLVLAKGKITSVTRLFLKLALEEYGIKVFIKCADSEEQLIEELLKLLCLFPKPLIGQNLTHFDLGIITNKIKKYNLLDKYKCYFSCNA